MPVPFGFSIGDFIAFIDVAVTVIGSLKESTGSAAEYQGVIRELGSLKTALKQIEDLKVEDAVLKKALEEVAANCGKTIQEFLNKIQKYEPFLKKGGSTQKWKDGLRKIQWGLYSKEDMRKFQAQLQSHTASLNILMERIHMASTSAASQSNKTALIRLEAKIGEQKMIQLVILHALSRCWAEFRGMMVMIIAANFRIFNLLLASSKLPRQIEFEKPIIFEDAHGRLLPIPMQWVTCWKHFETMLEMKFEDVPGLCLIRTGNYILEDVFSHTDINRSSPIQQVFRPGRKINMSMLFKLQDSMRASCLKCGAPNSGPTDTDIKCAQCGLWWRLEVPKTTLDIQKDQLPGSTITAMPDNRISLAEQARIGDFARVRIQDLTVVQRKFQLRRKYLPVDLSNERLERTLFKEKEKIVSEADRKKAEAGSVLEETKHNIKLEEEFATKRRKDEYDDWVRCIDEVEKKMVENRRKMLDAEMHCWRLAKSQEHQIQAMLDRLQATRVGSTREFYQDDGETQDAGLPSPNSANSAPPRSEERVARGKTRSNLGDKSVFSFLDSGNQPDIARLEGEEALKSASEESESKRGRPRVRVRGKPRIRASYYDSGGYYTRSSQYGYGYRDRYRDPPATVKP